MSGEQMMTAIHPQEEWEAHLAAGRFMLQYSPSTQQHVFFPRVVAPGSGARDLVWVPASGLGVVHAVTVMRPRPPAEPYNVTIIELAEGPRILGRVEGIDPSAVEIGSPVRGRVGQIDGHACLVFRPEGIEEKS